MASDRDKFELPAFVVTEAKKFLEDEGEPILRPPKNSDERVLWIGWSFASEEQCLLDPKSLKIAPHRNDYWDDGSGFTEESTTLAAESAAIVQRLGAKILELIAELIAMGLWN